MPLCYVFHIMNAWDDGADGRYVWLDAGRHEVYARGTSVALPLKEFELLELLMANAGRVR